MLPRSAFGAGDAPTENGTPQGATSGPPNAGGSYEPAPETPCGNVWYSKRPPTRDGGRRNYNLRTKFTRILARAAVEEWPRLFHKLRASRETELARQFPIRVVTRWLGDTPCVARKHYLQITDPDFDKALAGGPKSGTESATASGGNT